MSWKRKRRNGERVFCFVIYFIFVLTEIFLADDPSFLPLVTFVFVPNRHPRFVLFCFVLFNLFCSRLLLFVLVLSEPRPFSSWFYFLAVFLSRPCPAAPFLDPGATYLYGGVSFSFNFADEAPGGPKASFKPVPSIRGQAAFMAVAVAAGVEGEDATDG